MTRLSLAQARALGLRPPDIELTPEGQRLADLQAEAAEARRARRPPARDGGRATRQTSSQSEEHEQRVLAQLLDDAGLVWWHTPNGGLRHKGAAGALQAQGVKPGVPDVLILTPAPATGRPVALELKRASLAPRRAAPVPPWARSCFSPEQQWWLAAFEAFGWHALVAYGAADAVGQLRSLGYAACDPKP